MQKCFSSPYLCGSCGTLSQTKVGFEKHMRTHTKGGKRREKGKNLGRQNKKRNKVKNKKLLQKNVKKSSSFSGSKRCNSNLSNPVTPIRKSFSTNTMEFKTNKALETVDWTKPQNLIQGESKKRIP